MSHEPECCQAWTPDYKDENCECEQLRKAYRRGYNDRAMCSEVGDIVWGFGCN